MNFIPPDSALSDLGWFINLVIWKSRRSTSWRFSRFKHSYPWRKEAYECCAVTVTFKLVGPTSSAQPWIPRTHTYLRISYTNLHKYRSKGHGCSQYRDNRHEMTSENKIKSPLSNYSKSYLLKFYLKSTKIFFREFTQTFFWKINIK